MLGKHVAGLPEDNTYAGKSQTSVIPLGRRSAKSKLTQLRVQATCLSCLTRLGHNLHCK